MKRLNKQKGFTLVELLVVVAIIAILVLIAIPRFAGSTSNAKLKTFEGNARTIASQVVQYQAQNGGSTKDIEKAGVVKEFVEGLAGKPAGATYTLDKDKCVCILTGDGFNNYTVTVTFATGAITSNGATSGVLPAGLSGSFPAK